MVKLTLLVGSFTLLGLALVASELRLDWHNGKRMRHCRSGRRDVATRLRGGRRHFLAERREEAVAWVRYPR